jgi:hypothetical protein
MLARRRILPLVLAALGILPGCGPRTPLQPVNRSPVALSLTAFPSSIGPSDSAFVVCVASDPDGDSLAYFWGSDCRIVKKGQFGQEDLYSRSNTLVVYPGTCVHAPTDTGWVSCEISDRRGGGAYVGTVYIVIHQ